MPLAGRLALAATLLVLAACPSTPPLVADAGCPAGTTACGSVCASTTTDDANCGGCDKACSLTESCAASHCWQDDCGSTNCSAQQVCWQGHCAQKTCVGVTCNAGETCFDGACQPERCGTTPCTAGSVCVSGVCTDVACLGVTCQTAGQVCVRGLCVDACAPTSACTTNPGAPCFGGTVACDGGCVDATPATAGTACGANQVCSASGACVSCTPGASCATNPSAPCKRGVLQCSSGAPVCVDDVATDAGVACGTGRVCDGAGACLGCDAGASCGTNVGAPCVQGVVACGSGHPVCADSAPAAAGTACGLTSVCTGDGGCVGCAAGAGCSANPGAPCLTGALDCTLGAPRCLDTATKLDAGTTCGSNQVCSPTGLCVGCTASLACATNPDPCKVGTTSCASGGSTCVNTTSNAPTGTSCGGANVCVTGTCKACTAHADCGTGKNCVAGACEAAATTCSALKTAHASLGDGEYFIGATPVLTYCDMTLKVPLCAADATQQLRTGRMRDGSALDFEMQAKLLAGSGECELYALRNPASGHPFDYPGSPNTLCGVMGFKADSTPITSCDFGAGNPSLGCGFPGENGTNGYYRYGYSCSGCGTNNGTFTQYVIQGTMSTASIVTDFTGSRVVRCKTR